MFQGAFPAITNRQGFVDEVEVIDADDGTPIDLTGSTIQVAICGQVSPYFYDYGHWPVSPNFGAWGYPRLLATTADGTVTIPEIGVFIFTFTPAQIATLCPGQYVVACNMARDGETIQPILGTMSVLDGVVPQ